METVSEMKSLESLIQESESLIQWLDQQIDGVSMPENPRNRLAGGCLYVAMEHQKAIILLVANRLCGSAFALTRLLFEAYVRGIWLHRCADDNELKKYTTDDVPKFYRLLESVETLEGHQDKVLSTLKNRVWSALNGYAHTGMHQIARQQTEATIEPNYEYDEIAEVINFANGMGFLAAIATCELGNNVELLNDIYKKMKAHWDADSGQENGSKHQDF